MKRSSWDRIQEIYYSALPIVEPERQMFVEIACGSDLVLAREVTSLLEADKSTGDFLEPPIFEFGLRIITSESAPPGEDSLAFQAGELIGATIDDRYLVEKALGHGGIGTVYLARDLKLHNRPIVIKILLQASLQDPYVLKKFRQEVEALARIDHPGVVSVLGAGELADGKPYIAMQYINGVTLRSQIPSEGVNFDRAASIIKQVGAALDDVHEKGILHRDLKPENIMLQTLKGGTELVKIVDFGIAKVKDSVVAASTANQASVGTVLYMSPEQLRGVKVTAVSDVYSMAATAYEMVTGRRPFNPNSAHELLEMQRAGIRVKPVDLRPSLSTEAQAIILRALSFEPEDRYQSASEFGDALARALSADEARPTPTNPNAKERVLTEKSKDQALNALAATGKDSSDRPFMPAPDSAAAALEPINLYAGRPRKASTWRVLLGLSLILFAGIAALLGVYILRAHKQASGSASGSQRSFTYWLTVQKTRDGRNYQDPFQSSGDEVFENGNKFRLNISSPDPGYLYIFNEGPPEEDGTTLTMFYPTPLRNNAFVSNQPVHTNWNIFKGQAGTENIWIVWSATSVSQLEAVKTESFNNRKGALSDVNSIRAVRDFLTTHAEPKPDSTKDPTAQQTHVRGVGDVVVKLAQLEHR